MVSVILRTIILWSIHIEKIRLNLEFIPDLLT
mgnify:CR=1